MMATIIVEICVSFSLVRAGAKLDYLSWKKGI
jgi:hypothetical protein